ncbi:putative flippase GtrA [Cupriavidus metallidurans]|uniref:GtrA family protein n=2 Tax=Cupriavidus TaxID=106589 RepID=A0A3G8GUK7_9BURK|nr:MULTISPECIES: GtrA family protein [Cupriavidus]AZG11927.1 GtrA family protein [Cupriavidus pauculus]KAB0600887.1 GtrA family protein [Cupriavidus pauculus]MDE4922465.1 GtrA family protein [Cupriavidus metallidurans]QBP14601.1 GtrA family protein [Cupriavidus metallidurans]UAL02632.1 GtrA family protein [Cupriavidus pauculus]
MTIPARFVRFLGAGATATALHYAALIALVSFGAPALPASAAGSVVGLLSHYFISSRWVFVRAHSERAAFVRFILVSVLAFLLNSILMWAGLAVGLHYLIAQIASTLLVMLVNYVLHANWTFMNGAMR